MGILSYTYNAAKAAFRGKGKVSPTITSVKPSVPKTKAEKVKSKLKILKQRTKGSQARLDQNLFETEQASKKRKEFKKGTPFKKETNVDKIKKTFAPKSKIKFDAKKSDLDKSGSLSPYEKRRGMAIAKAMAKRKKKVI
jgi:hypothetical protein